MTEPTKSKRDYWKYIALLSLFVAISKFGWDAYMDMSAKSGPRFATEATCVNFELQPMLSDLYKLPTDLESENIFKLKSFIQISLRNAGDLPANKAFLQLPNAHGRVLIERPNKTEDYTRFTGEVALGDIAVNQYIVVKIWTFEKLRPKSIPLVHDLGMQTISLDSTEQVVPITSWWGGALSYVLGLSVLGFVLGAVADKMGRFVGMRNRIRELEQATTISANPQPTPHAQSNVALPETDAHTAATSQDYQQPPAQPPLS